jgi:hypothetical protein
MEIRITANCEKNGVREKIFFLKKKSSWSSAVIAYTLYSPQMSYNLDEEEEEINLEISCKKTPR